VKKTITPLLFLLGLKAHAMDIYCNGAPTTIHANGGGVVALTAIVDDSVYVGPNVSVCEFATVLGNAQLNDQVRVYGYAHIGDGTLLTGNAEIYGNASLVSNPPSQIVKVSDSVKVYGNADVSQAVTLKASVRVFDNAKLSGNAVIDESAQIYGNATITGAVLVKGTAKVHGSTAMDRDTIISGTSNICSVKHYPANTTLDNIQDCPAQPPLMSTSQVVAGENHTCILLSKGKVRCWGNNSYGQLGTGNTTNIGDDELPTATQLVLSDVKTLSAGYRHTCALLNTGAVKCWGANAEGELGIGNILSTTVPGAEVNLGGTAIQIASGSYHTCALMNNGSVRCFGWSGYGQLGYGNTNSIGDNELPIVAGDVNLGEPALQIAAGVNHTCAVLASKKVKCWGFNNVGQLGVGHTTTLYAPADAVNLGGDAVQVVAGLAHSCALLTTGRVKCWGANAEGELGYGNTTGLLVPGDEINLGENATQLTAGAYHTCALMVSGAIRCWGWNAYGQLGYGNQSNIGDDEVPSAAGIVNVGSIATEIAAGANHTCALLSSKAVRCWGLNNNGQLGYGNTINIGDNETPASVGDITSQFTSKKANSWSRHAK
jgi:alpha-tubulin suppressor-like RCC1 family protein/acyl-[acyl carrier protein]--UDP-N-acetylglucosamine O-acyltransferase